MYGCLTNRKIESDSLSRAKQKRNEGTTTTTSSDSESTRSLNTSEVFVEDSHGNTVIPRPTCHLDDQCFCYENATDCTTCTSKCTEDSDIFMLTSSESRSRAGGSTSSGDGSSLLLDDFREKINDSSGSCSSSCVSSLREFDELAEILNRKARETSEDFQKMSEAFGRTLTMTGFQRGVIGDTLEALEEKLDDGEFRITAAVEKVESAEISVDTTLILMAKCRRELADARGVYLRKLMDEDLMKSNLCRAREMKAALEAMRRGEAEMPKSELPEDFDKILDDVSTGRSFCLGDL